MPLATIVEQVLGRTYSKGVRVLWSSVTPPDTLTVNDAWLATFQLFQGVKSVTSSEVDRDVIELMELDNIPSTITSAEEPEIFYTKIKAPGDKDHKPMMMELNANGPTIDIVQRLYYFDTITAFIVLFPSGALQIMLGYVQSIEPSVEGGKIVNVSVELQPSFGVQYLSQCPNFQTFYGFWRNYLSNAVCQPAYVQPTA